mmetsp:Transcript_131436/g.232223  ORF Transcript_131436/g.232223 Transcript_131436/m.232223 type:complete len:107 (+) Transcript_131436:141-461(+)
MGKHAARISAWIPSGESLNMILVHQYSEQQQQKNGARTNDITMSTITSPGLSSSASGVGGSSETEILYIASSKLPLVEFVSKLVSASDPELVAVICDFGIGESMSL